MSKQRMDVQTAEFSLRDWFAGQALSGLLATSMHADLAVKHAYEIADQMLKARG